MTIKTNQITQPLKMFQQLFSGYVSSNLADAAEEFLVLLLYQFSVTSLMYGNKESIEMHYSYFSIKAL